MVKTKPAVKRKAKPVEDEEEMTTTIKPVTKKQQRDIIDKNVTHVKAYDPKTVRPKGDWWADLLSGETCRTSDKEKMHTLIDRAIEERRSFNIQGIAERNQTYYFYVTNICTTEEQTPPSQKKKK